jgi:hypothetical protein
VWDRALVVLKGPARVELQQEVSPLGVDEKCGVTRLEIHPMMAITETTRPRTIEITTIQMRI